MPFVVQFGQVCGHMENLILVVFRNESIGFAKIEGGPGVNHIFDGLQLGSAGNEVGHFGYQGFVLVE